MSRLTVSYFNRSSVIFVISGLAFVIAMSTFFFFLSQASDTQKNVESEKYTSQEVVVFVNEQRKKDGLAPLIINDELTRAAEQKAQDMITDHYFSHINEKSGKKWSDFIKYSGYSYLQAGENLANGYSNTSEMVAAWMNSPTHKANILEENVSETGVALIRGKLNEKPTTIVVQLFGKRDYDTPNTFFTPQENINVIFSSDSLYRKFE